MTSFREVSLVMLATALLAACGDSEQAATSAAAAPAGASGTGAGAVAVPAAVDSTGAAVAAAPGDDRAAASSAASQELAAGTPRSEASTSAPAQVASAEAVEPAPQGAPDAASILRRAERAYDALRSLEADFVQDLSVPLLNSTQRSRGKMYHRQPDRFLMRFSDPQGDVVVADGRYLWMYYPSNDAKQVMRASIGDNGQSVDLQREFLSNPTARYNATLEGTETVAGRSAYVLTLVPKQASTYRRIRLWVDQGDALVRRFEILEQNDALRRLELTNLRPNQPLGDALFRFTPPAGTQIFEQ